MRLSFVIVLLLSLFISSCSNVVYKNAVPEESQALNVFPDEIQGKYIDNEGDTLSIYQTEYTYGSKSDLVYLSGELSNELVLKSFSGYYFLNFKSDEGYWEMMAAKATNNDLAIFCIDVQNKEDIETINSHIKKGKIKSLRKEGKYIIDPTGNEIIDIISKSAVCEQTILKRIE